MSDLLGIDVIPHNAPYQGDSGSHEQQRKGQNLNSNQFGKTLDLASSEDAAAGGAEAAGGAAEAAGGVAEGAAAAGGAAEAVEGLAALAPLAAL